MTISPPPILTAYARGHESADAAPVDPARWPDVARLPRSTALRTAVARRIVEHALSKTPVRIRHGARNHGGIPAPADGGGGHPILVLHDPAAFHRRIGADGLIGFGESYMAGEWDADDLVAVLTALASHADDLVPAPLRRLRARGSTAAPPKTATAWRAPATTSAATTTSRTTSSPSSSTPA